MAFNEVRKSFYFRLSLAFLFLLALHAVLQLIITVYLATEYVKESEQELNWSYLGAQNWQRISDLSILSDSTYGLITTGIVSLQLPKTMSENSPTVAMSRLPWSRPQMCRHPGFSKVRFQYSGRTGIGPGTDPRHNLPRRRLSRTERSALLLLSRCP